MADSVQFHGFVSPEKLRQLYREAAVFTMPSRAEGFGFVFLEAMNYGLPVVAGNMDATTEVVIDGQTGYLVDPQDVDAIANRLSLLFSDPDKRRRMGQAGQERVQRQFSLAQFQATLAGYIRELY